MAFQGSLKELPLPDIIQLVSVSGKTGKFSLSREGDRGFIYLKAGQMVHAEVGELIGEEAIYSLAIWTSGDFLFSAGEEAQQQTITKSNTNLLMEAARRSDEWRVLSKKIPSVEMVVELMARENRHEQITLNPQEWLLVTRINGQRSVSDIAKLLGISSFDVSKVLYGLITAELVHLKKKVSESGGEYVELATRIRSLVEQHIGPGHKTIDRNYFAAVEAIGAGEGMAAIRTMVSEFEKTASLLRGMAVTEQLRAEIGHLTSIAS